MVTDTFSRLSTVSTEISDEDLAMIQRFVILLYDRSSSCDNVNSARRFLFTKKGRSIDNCPPTLNALMQHIYRAIYQSSIWRNAQILQHAEADVSNYGWIVTDNIASPTWMTIPEAAKSCQELIKCGCKKICSGRCKCKKGGFKCTELCQCGGGCTNTAWHLLRVIFIEKRIHFYNLAD